MPNLHCGYCLHYANAETINKNRPRAAAALKHCAADKKITFNTIACEYFAKSESFFCDHFEERYGHLICLYRRSKHDNEQFNYCRTCEQFINEVLPIIDKFCIQAHRPRVIKTVKLKTRRKKTTGKLKKRRRRNDKKDTRVPSSKHDAEPKLRGRSRRRNRR